MNYKEVWKDHFKKLGNIGIQRKDVSDKEQTAIKGIMEYVIQAYGYEVFKNQCVLDYGCGIGRFFNMFDSADCKYIGLDLTKQNIDYCKSQYFSTFKEVDGEIMHLDDNSIEVIFTSTVLQHIPESGLLKLKKEFDRVLVPGGSMILFENTTEIESESEWVFFRPWTFYKDLFDFMDLQRKIDIIDIANEKHTLIIGGRK